MSSGRRGPEVDSLVADERGAVVQVGFILVITILLLALATFQLTAVPDQNRQAEFGDYQRAGSDLTAMYGDVRTAAARDVGSTATVRTGSQYPARMLLVNPPPAAGDLRTGEPRQIGIDGAVAAEGAPENLGAVWNGSERTYQTRHLRFDPDYNELEAQPLVTTGHGVYLETDRGPRSRTGQSLLRGNRISLVALTGDVDERGYEAAIGVEPVSAATRTVPVTGENGANVTVTLPTPGQASAWLDSSAAETIRENPRVLGLRAVGEQQVAIDLDGDRTYELRVANVELGDPDRAPADDPEAAYLVKTAGDDAVVNADQRATLTVEARDRFNNPVSDATVEFETADGSFADGSTSTTVTTDEDGRATVRYDPAAEGIETVTARLLGGVGSDLGETAFSIQVSGPSGGSGSGDDVLGIGSGTADGPTGMGTGVRFDVTNRDDGPIDVVGLSVVRTSTDATMLRETRTGEGRWNREVFVAVGGSDPTTKSPADGYYEAGDGGGSDRLSIGDEADLTGPNADVATLSAGETAEVSLYQFRVQSGQGSAVSQSGEFLEVRITYETADGTVRSTTATVVVF